MPSVNVPSGRHRQLDKLQGQRRAFWGKEANNNLSRTSRPPSSDATTARCTIVARPAMVKLCRVFLEPMRAKFGPCLRPVRLPARAVQRPHRRRQALAAHLRGQGFESVAADLRFQRGSPAQWAAYAKGLRARRRAVRVGWAATTGLAFVHVDNRTYKADWSG